MISVGWWLTLRQNRGGGHHGSVWLSITDDVPARVLKRIAVLSMNQGST
jgi:hypothetical protein